MSVPTTKKRIDIIDALRGFSLAGIVIVHMVENYIGGPSPEGTMDATRVGIADTIVDGFIFLFLRGKFFALFSFLFGLSFFIQMDNAKNKEGDYRLRFLWRLVLLLLIGYVHHLFYRGDILTIYALIGFFLIPFHRIQNKWVLGLAALLFLGLGRYVVFLITNGDNPFLGGNFDPNSPMIKGYFETIKNGTLGDVFLSNATEGHLMKMDFQLGVFSRGYLTFAFFLLGLYVGRTQFFQNLREHKRLVKRTLIWSAVLFVVSLVLTGVTFSQLGDNVSFDNWTAMLGLTFYDLNNLAMTLVILALFVMAYRKKWGYKMLNPFAPYGRMALTNYVFQTLVGTFFFFGWGLGYLGELRNSYTFLIAIAIIAAQMALSKWWLQKFHYGPLEWLWRSLTYFKHYPLTKTQS